MNSDFSSDINRQIDSQMENDLPPYESDNERNNYYEDFYKGTRRECFDDKTYEEVLEENNKNIEFDMINFRMANYIDFRYPPLINKYQWKYNSKLKEKYHTYKNFLHQQSLYYPGEVLFYFNIIPFNKIKESNIIFKTGEVYKNVKDIALLNKIVNKQIQDLNEYNKFKDYYLKKSLYRGNSLKELKSTKFYKKCNKIPFPKDRFNEIYGKDLKPVRKEHDYVDPINYANVKSGCLDPESRDNFKYNNELYEDYLNLDLDKIKEKSNDLYQDIKDRKAFYF